MQFSSHHESVAPLPATAWHVFFPGLCGDGGGGGDGGPGDGGGVGGLGPGAGLPAIQPVVGSHFVYRGGLP